MKLLPYLSASLLLLATACGSQPSWKEFSSPGGKFSAMVPGIPEEKVQAINTPAGKIEQRTYMVDLKHSLYALGYADLPEVIKKVDPQIALTGGVKGAVSNSLGASGKITSQTQTSLDGFPCQDFTAEGKVKEVDAKVQGRFCLVETRLYEVFVVGEKNKLVAEDTNKFLQSFKRID